MDRPKGLLVEVGEVLDCGCGCGCLWDEVEDGEASGLPKIAPQMRRFFFGSFAGGSRGEGFDFFWSLLLWLWL